MKSENQNKETAMSKFSGFFADLDFEYNNLQYIDLNNEKINSMFLFTEMKIYPENVQVKFSNQKCLSSTKLTNEKN